MVAAADRKRSRSSGAFSRRALAHAAAVASLGSLMACHPISPSGERARQTEPSPPPLKPVASVGELMDSIVDPAADGLWDSVATISSQKGVEKREPRTEEDWKGVRRHAISLIESMNLVMMTGRHAAPPGTEPGPGELTPAQIDAMIEANRPEFYQFAEGVRDRATDALRAIDRKDPQELFGVGSDIDRACEGCHVTFWYPNSARPPEL